MWGARPKTGITAPLGCCNTPIRQFRMGILPSDEIKMNFVHIKENILGYLGLPMGGAIGYTITIALSYMWTEE